MLPSVCPAFDAVVLSGGAARRLDGADKPGIEVGGVSLLERVVAACADAGTVVVVGPERELPVRVRWARETPAGAGPVAAVAAGFRYVGADIVLVLAADLPWIAPAIPALIAAVDDAAVLVDAAGQRNLLAAAWRRDALGSALAGLGDPTNAAMRSLYAGVACAEVADPDGWGQDCDTWADVANARERTT